MKVSGSSEEYWKSIFDAYYERLLSFAMLYVKYTDAAEDVVSEVFLRIFKNPEKSHQIHDINFYLHKCVKNQSLNYLRARRRLWYFDGDSNFEYLQIDHHGPESQYLTEELKAELELTIENLSPKRKLVYQLVTENGLKQKEISELLDISVKTVENHMLEATRQIRIKIKKYLDH